MLITNGADGTVAQGFDLRSGNVTFFVPFVPEGSYIITCESFDYEYHVADTSLMCLFASVRGLWQRQPTLYYYQLITEVADFAVATLEVSWS